MLRDRHSARSGIRRILALSFAACDHRCMISVKPSISPLAVRDFADGSTRILSVSVTPPCDAHVHGLIRIILQRPGVAVRQEVALEPRTGQGFAALVMAIELQRTRELFRFFRSARRVAAMAFGFAAGVAAFIGLAHFLVMVLADPLFTRAAQIMLIGGVSLLALHFAIRAFKASLDNAD